jgi:uncharacterized membrane protein YhaH (DUF805 family)
LATILRKTGGLLSFNGRAERKEFAAVAGPLVLFEGALVWLSEMLAPDGLGDTPWFWPYLLLVFAPIALVAPVVVRRLHDLGRSAIWAFLFGTAANLLTVLLVWAGLPEAENPVLLAALSGALIYLVAAPGHAGDNQFGPGRTDVAT